MPTPTYTPLANTTLASASSTVTFSSISQAYRDLIVVLNFPTTASVGDVGMRFNSDTGTNYTYVEAFGSGASTGSSAGSRSYNVIGYLTSVTRIATISQIMDYSATDKHKTTLTRENDAAGTLRMLATRWANTSAVTSLSLITQTNSFPIGSTFSLYGIVA
jgi:hypothetical protein